MEMIRYLYRDKVNLSGSNVYLATKYMVLSLAVKSAQYLRRNLKLSNEICILPYAEKCEDEDLGDRC